MLRVFDGLYTSFIIHSLRTRPVPDAEFDLGSYNMDLFEKQ